MQETVTIHTMTTSGGAQVKYARVFRNYGRTLVGQSVLLHRLTPHQLRIAKEAPRDVRIDSDV